MSGAIVSVAKRDVCAPIDANGNLTSDGTRTYYWNALKQLVEVRQGATTLATFEYDGGGRRTEKVATGVTHAYIYDAEDIAEERLSGSTADTIRYYHGAGIDEPLVRKNSSDVVTYYLSDHLGSVVLETSSAGAITLQREYDPWGVLVQGDVPSGFSFTGREWDSETGLYFLRARYYEPAVGRFISEDPLSFGGGTNFLAYVSNYPTGATDLFGLTEARGTDWKPTSNLMTSFLQGAVLSIVGTGALVGAAAAAAAVGVPTGIITGILGVTGGLGGALTAVTIVEGISSGDYDQAAYGAGGLVGGAVTGAGSVTKIPGVDPNAPWTISGGKRFKWKLGTPYDWLSTGPDKASGAGAAALTGAGAASAARSCKR